MSRAALAPPPRAAGLPVIVPQGGAAEEVVHPQGAVLVPAVLVRRARSSGFLIRVAEEGEGEKNEQGLASLQEAAAAGDLPNAGTLAGALEAVLTNASAPARLAAAVGPPWAAQVLSIEHSADAVLAEVMKRRARGL